MSPDILLIAAEWRPRALINAELLEQGFDVVAVETWDEAELRLRARAVRPRLTIFDVDGDDHPEAALTTLAQLVRADEVLVLTSESVLPAARLAAMGYRHVLPRPFMIKAIVAQARTLLQRVPHA